MSLQVVHDPLADVLDDMAALGLHWTRNRERGRMPEGIRGAMILLAKEVLALDQINRNRTSEQACIQGLRNVIQEDTQ